MKKIFRICLSAAFILFCLPSFAQCWCAFLTGLTASQQTNKQVKISWNTDTESSTAMDFIIQRSYTGSTSDMTDIGYVSANPNALSASYTFYDAYPCNGSATTVYYRLKGVNIDANVRYSSIVSASISGCPSGCSVVQTCRCALNTWVSHPSLLCSGTASFEIGNASGPVTWSVSNTSVATITSTTSTRAILTKVGDGVVTVTAAISGCTGLTQQVVVGVPSPTGLGQESAQCIGGTDWDATIRAYPTDNAFTYLWSIDGGSFYSSGPYYYLNQWTNSSAAVSVKIQTSCGSSSTYGPVTFYSPCPGFRAMLSPNPAKDFVVVSVVEQANIKKSLLKDGPLEVSIYSFDNSLLLGTHKALTGAKNLRLNTRMLKPGKYLLHIKYRGETLVQQVLIQ